MVNGCVDGIETNKEDYAAEKLISVIVPCYNVANYIDRCLESIVNQSIGISSLEIICINDCSTDNTKNMIENWELRFPEDIMLVDCEQNVGLGAVRNIGTEYASCKYIAYIDSDDWIERDYFERMYSIITKGEYQVVACGHKRDTHNNLVYFDRNSRSEIVGKECIIDSLNARKNFFHEQPMKLYAWGKLIDREFLIKYSIFFPEHLAYEDVIWGNDIYMYADKCFVIDEALYHYYVKVDSLILKPNAAHHIDHFTINELLWQDWCERGFFDNYHDELIYEYYYDAYLATLKILSYRFDEPQFSLFRLLQEMVREKIPYGTRCSYLDKKEIPELHRLLINMIYEEVNKDQFIQMVSNIKEIGL